MLGIARRKTLARDVREPAGLGESRSRVVALNRDARHFRDTMDKPKHGDTGTRDQKQVRISAKWGDASELRSELATEVNVLGANNQVVLTFGEVRLPLFDRELPGTIEGEIRPVARIVIPASSFPGILRALNSASGPIASSG